MKNFQEILQMVNEGKTIDFCAALREIMLDQPISKELIKAKKERPKHYSVLYLAESQLLSF